MNWNVYRTAAVESVNPTTLFTTFSCIWCTVSLLHATIVHMARSTHMRDLSVLLHATRSVGSDLNRYLFYDDEVRLAHNIPINIGSSGFCVNAVHRGTPI